MNLPEARAGSWEDVCHQASKGQNAIFLPSALRSHPVLEKRIGNRAVGVVYNPNHDYNQYVPSIIPKRYDAFVWCDKTKAIHALPKIEPDLSELPNLYPWGV